MKNILFPAAFLLTTAAYAGDMPEFSEVDVNADGVLSVDEASVIEGLDFATADTDSDGAISLEEYAALLGS